MATKPTAVRLTTDQLAKARDGLINCGIGSKHLTTKSSVLRLAIFLAITKTKNPNSPPSEESLSILSI